MSRLPIESRFDYCKSFPGWLKFYCAGARVGRVVIAVVCAGVGGASAQSATLMLARASGHVLSLSSACVCAGVGAAVGMGVGIERRRGLRGRRRVVAAARRCGRRRVRQ